MSQIDTHIARVRGRLFLGRLVESLSRLLLAGTALLLAAVVIERLARIGPGRWDVLLLGASVLVLVMALAAELRRRPSPHDAAVEIDRVLGLKEKFSTALYARSMRDDPFAAAAIADANRTAASVSLDRKFPIRLPPHFWLALGVGAIAFGTWALVPQMDLMGREAAAQKQLAEKQADERARQSVEAALTAVNTVAPLVDDRETKLQMAAYRDDLQALLARPTLDPQAAARTAAKASADAEKAVETLKQKNVAFAAAKADERLMRSMAPSNSEKGPVADVQRKLSEGKFTEAIEDLQSVVNNFDKMESKDQAQAAQQMQNLAQQMQQMANNPQMQQQAQQQLQQMGMSQQQAQQMVQQMQQAAQGNQQAAQQLAQQAQQMMQNMNPAQQQAMQQAMAQAQAAMNNQATAQQMAQAAQAMAQAMQQATQQGQQQAQQGQQAQAQAGQQGQQQGQQNGQQQQGAQQGGQQGNPAQGGQQGMGQAMANMQQQMGAMQAMASDAQQVAAAQQAAANAAAAAHNAMNGGQGEGEGDMQMAQGQPGEWKAGDADKQGGGAGGGPGQAIGDRTYKAAAPYAVKAEFSPGTTDEKGRLLASTLIKADALRGESTAELREVTEAAVKDATDDVNQQRISRAQQKVVRDYFNTVAGQVERAE